MSIGQLGGREFVSMKSFLPDYLCFSAILLYLNSLTLSLLSSDFVFNVLIQSWFYVENIVRMSMQSNLILNIISTRPLYLYLQLIIMYKPVKSKTDPVKETGYISEMFWPWFEN